MIYLLDTCTFVWLCTEPTLLSEKATEAINGSESHLMFSDVSVMEIVLKWNAGKIQLPDPPATWVEFQVRKWSLSFLDLKRSDIYRSSELPDHHRDPFDRLLVSVAINRNATIVTPDIFIRKYPVSTCW